MFFYSNHNPYFLMTHSMLKCILHWHLCIWQTLLSKSTNIAYIWSVLACSSFWKLMSLFVLIMADCTVSCSLWFAFRFLLCDLNRLGEQLSSAVPDDANAADEVKLLLVVGVWENKAGKNSSFKPLLPPFCCRLLLPVSHFPGMFLFRPGRSHCNGMQRTTMLT